VSSEETAYVTLAKVAKTQGRHGEVAADLFTDFPERFAERRKLYAWQERSGIRELELEEYWPHKGRVVLKFAGIDSIDDAETLIGAEIRIPASERAELEEGAVYISDLTGCKVLARSGERDAGEIGKVADVDFSAGEAPLLVVRQGKKEHLVPFVERFVVKLDTAAKRLEMQLPEGLLELEEPEK
jgi:16S rRNA processing protein RimM